MIKINDVTYSGNLVPSQDSNKLSVILYTFSTIQDLSIALDHATEVVETDFSGTETVYKVNDVVCITKVSENTFVADFSIKPTAMQEMSNAIDQLLVMALEG